MHWINPDSLKESRHRVRQFLLNPHGHVEGFVSTKGVQVHVPPHMGELLTGTVAVGERIGIRGYRPKAADVLVAVALEPKRGERIVDEGPSSHEPHKAAKPAKSEIQGITERPIYGPRGEPVGILLTSGVSVRFDPALADELAEFLVPDTRLAAEGELRSNEWGSVLDADYIWLVERSDANSSDPEQ